MVGMVGKSGFMMKKKRKRGFSTTKMLVRIASLVASLMGSHETVQVKLSLEGLVFNLIEIRRHDLVREFRGLVDFEGGTTIVPGDNVGKVVFFRILDHLVELGGECVLGGTNVLESEDSHGGLVEIEFCCVETGEMKNDKDGCPHIL
jgi:hypothetical protein